MGKLVAARILATFLVLHLFAVDQISGGGDSSEDIISVSYDGVFGETPVKVDIGQLRTLLASYRTKVRDFSFSVGKTQTIVDLGKLMKGFSLKAANVLIDYVESVENIVSTGNVPGHEIFEYFEEANQNLQKFLAKDAVELASRLHVLIGCPPSRVFKSVFRNMGHQVEYIAKSASGIVKAVGSGKDKREYVQRQAVIISNRVVKLSKIIERELAESVVQLADRIENANALVTSMFLENITKQTIGETINSTQSYINDVRDLALNTYISGEQSIRTNLGISIDQLLVYRNFKVVGKISHEIEESYIDLYHYMHKQNRYNIDYIEQSYNMTAVNTETLINETAKLFLDESKHTVLEFIDFFLEGRISKQCLADYQNPISDTYAKFTLDVTECLDQEKSFWNQTIQAFSSSIDLIQSSTNQVAASIAHCASFASCNSIQPPPMLATLSKQNSVPRSLFCTGSTDLVADELLYARTKACLKTNLRDMHQLINVLEPQFEHVDGLIKLDVDVGAFRLENCMKTRLREQVSQLRTVRELVRTCLKRIDECPLQEICHDSPSSGEKCDRQDSEEDSNEKDLLRETWLEGGIF